MQYPAIIRRDSEGNDFVVTFPDLEGAITGAGLPEITQTEVFKLLAARYADKPDDFKLIIGHQSLPFPNQHISIYNLPEIQGYMSLEMRDIRRFAAIAPEDK